MAFMSKFPMRLVLTLFSLIFAGCEGRIVVPIRACVVKGNAWTKAADPGPNAFPPPPGEGGYFYSEGTETIDQGITDLVQGANKIWAPGANIAFLLITYPGEDGHIPNGHFPVIADPKPPGDSTLPFDRSHYGDIEVKDHGTSEMEDAVHSCDAAWTRGGVNAPPDTIIIIIARNFVSPTNSLPVNTVGLNTGHYKVANRNNGKDLCEVPRNLTKEDILTQYVIIVDPSLFLPSHLSDSRQGQGQGQPTTILAHELGHALMLNHGDGLDNDSNGIAPPDPGARRFDLDCDPVEYSKYDEAPATKTSSLMSASGNITTITPLQRELARTAAILAPGAFGGPP
jgi:hypothetical protein